MIKLVKIVIEGMHNVSRKTYNLQNLTYLHGPNGAGKSTVMQAIQLALLGYIPGTSKASKEALFKHSNGHLLGVTLYLQDDDTMVKIERVWSGTGSTIHSSVNIEPSGYDIHEVIAELELPIFNFNEFIDLTANKMKDWFIEFLPSSKINIDWADVLQKSAQDAGFDITSGASFIQSAIHDIENMSETGLDLVRAANKTFKTALSFKKKELERAQATIQSLIYYDDIDSSISIDELDDQLAVYESLKAAREFAKQCITANARIEAQLQDYADCTEVSAESDSRYIAAAEECAQIDVELSEAATRISQYQQDMDALRAEQLELKSKQTELDAENKAKQSIVDSNGICPFTQSRCDSVQPLIKEYKQQINDNLKVIEALQTEFNKLSQSIHDVAAKVATINDNIATLHSQQLVCNNTMSDIKHRYADKHQLSLQIVIVPDTEDDDSDIDALIQELKDTQIKYEANRKYNKLIDTLTANKYAVEQEILAYKAWILLTDVNGLQSTAEATQPFVELQIDMNKYLHAVFGESVTAKFNVSAKANSFSFGVERDSVYIPFNLLSSGEKCMYTLSLMMSLTQLSKSPLKLVMVDDLLDHLDDVNIDRLFTSLETIEDIQMIFAGVKSVKAKHTIEVQ